ncbi:MAG: ester cyclase [bacterium]|nr:ester cyclase [bacterium]
MGNVNEKIIVKGFLLSGYEKEDYDFVLSYVSKDYLDHSPAGARSNEDVVAILKKVHKAFSNLHITILDLFGEDSIVATRVRFEGIQVGEYMGIQATHKKVTWEALENFRLANGKIVESWGYWPMDQIKAMLSE